MNRIWAVQAIYMIFQIIWFYSAFEVLIHDGLLGNSVDA
jgi:hypothetical protein